MRYVALLLVAFLVAACSPAVAVDPPGNGGDPPGEGGDPPGGDIPGSPGDLIRTVDLPPTAYGPLFNGEGDLMVIYQPALGSRASLVDMDGQVYPLPGHGDDGPAAWSNSSLAYLSRDDSLEPDPSVVSLFIYHTSTGTHVEARSPVLDHTSLYRPAFLSSGDVLVIGSGGIHRYWPADDTWTPVQDVGTSGATAFTWNHDGTAVAYASGEHLDRLRILDLLSGDELGVALSGEVVEAAWSNTGLISVLTRAGGDYSVTVVDSSSGDIVLSTAVSAPEARQLAWVPGADALSLSLISPGSGWNVSVLDTGTGQWQVVAASVRGHVWLDGDTLGCVREDQVLVYRLDW